MLFKTAALFFGLVGSVEVQADNSIIAGYLARSDASEHLSKDLIQEELETLIKDETCVSFALLEDYYNGDSGSGDGNYFSSIPTYGLGTGEELATVTKEYTKYYGKEDFHDQWVRKAIENKKTKFDNGNADFEAAFGSNDPDENEVCVGYEEVVKKGLAYTSTLYEAFQLAQKAIDLAAAGTCRFQRDNCTGVVDAWDSSVAIYVGSLEGEDGNNSVDGTYGKAPYALADKRCRNYKNCGPTHDLFTKNETAPINTKVLALYAAGSHASYIGDAHLMEYYLRLISNKVAVPLIQGTFRYYYRLSDLSGSFSTSDKEVGEGGAFAFGALPKLWACSKKAEKKAYPQIKLGGGIAGVAAVNFEDIQLAFECNYKCLGITCKEVGALYDDDDSLTPKPGFVACEDKGNGSENVCSKQKGNRKRACRLYTKKPGVKGRDKLKFDEFEFKD